MLLIFCILVKKKKDYLVLNNGLACLIVRWSKMLLYASLMVDLIWQQSFLICLPINSVFKDHTKFVFFFIDKDGFKERTIISLWLRNYFLICHSWLVCFSIYRYFFFFGSGKEFLDTWFKASETNKTELFLFLVSSFHVQTILTFFSFFFWRFKFKKQHFVLAM